MDAPQEVERTGNEYAPKALALLGDIAASLRASGFDAGKPYDMVDDMWRWSLTVRQPGLDDTEVYIEMPEAVEYDGEPEDGVNFGLGVVAWGGRVLGGIEPHNFTDTVWVHASDAAAVAGRWDEFECIARGYFEGGGLIEDLVRSPAEGA